MFDFLCEKYSKSCLTVNEVACEMGVTPKDVEELIVSGQLKTLCVGSKKLITIESLVAFLKSGKSFSDKSLVNIEKQSYITTNFDWQTFIAEEDDIDMTKGSVTYVAASDRWIVQLDMGKTPEGKRIRRSKSFKTEAEARDALAIELSKMYPSGIPEEKKAPTYREVALMYFNERPSSVTDRTWDTYVDFAKYSLQAVGDKAVDKITTADFYSLFNNMKVHYVNSTIKKTKISASLILKYAVEKGFVKTNVVQGIKLPKSEASIELEKEIRALTDAELKNVLSLVKDDKSIDGMIYLLAYTGMRPGELRGLKCSDINLENATLSIHRAVGSCKLRDKEMIVTGRKEYMKTIKNGDYGIRTLSVPKFVLEIALAQHKRMVNDAKYKGDINTDYLFPNKTGGAFTESAFNSRWRRFREKHKLDSDIYYPYVFRHTMCTNLILKGTPVSTVQRVLGDNSPEVIMQVYTHINRNDVAKAMGTVHNDYSPLVI